MTMRQQVTSLIREGFRNYEIAADLGCSAGYVSRVRVAVGIRTESINQKRAKTVIHCMLAGNTDEQIAKAFGVSAGQIRKIRDFNGIKKINISPHFRAAAKMKAEGNKSLYIGMTLNISETYVDKIMRKQRRLEALASKGLGNFSTDGTCFVVFDKESLK